MEQIDNVSTQLNQILCKVYLKEMHRQKYKSYGDRGLRVVGFFLRKKMVSVLLLNFARLCGPKVCVMN